MERYEPDTRRQWEWRMGEKSRRQAGRSARVPELEQDTAIAGSDTIVR